MATQQGNQILPFLFVGSRADAKSLEFLRRNKIKFILNCTQPLKTDPDNGCPNFYEKNTVGKTGEREFSYKRIPIFDNLGEDLKPFIDVALRFIDESRHHGNVFVHCNKGVSRSVSFVVAYLMKTSELSYDEALSMVQMFRGVAQPNAAFEEQLRRYGDELVQAREMQERIAGHAPAAYTSRESMEMSIGPARPPTAGPSLPEHVRTETVPETETETVTENNSKQEAYGDKESIGITKHSDGRKEEEEGTSSSPTDDQAIVQDLKRRRVDSITTENLN